MMSRNKANVGSLIVKWPKNDSPFLVNDCRSDMSPVNNFDSDSDSFWMSVDASP